MTYHQLNPWQQTSLKFYSKFIHFHSRKCNCISKCHLQNVGHFVQASLWTVWIGSINSLRPSDTIWLNRSRSTLAQVMACCLMARSHYLNQCWLIISLVPWHSSGGLNHHYHKIGIYQSVKQLTEKCLLNIMSISPRDQRVKYKVRWVYTKITFSLVSGTLY